MADGDLETRVTALEREVAELRSLRGLEPRQKDWRRTVGMFGNDEFMKSVFKEALRYRERSRRAARRAPAKSKRRKS
jgi:hypothetical protein